MFGLFRKRKPKPGLYAALLSAAHGDFIDSVTEMVTKSDPASRAMILVALANLDVYLSVMFKVGNENPKEGMPTTLDEAITFFEESLTQSQSEVGKRRIQWFLLASLVKRATQLSISEGNTHRIQDAWISLAEAGGNIRTIIRDNIIWDENEKIWFSDIKDRKAGVSYVLSLMMPKTLRKSQKLRAYADEQDIFLL